MTVEDMETLYDYGYWANAALLKVVAQLTPEEFTRAVAGSYGSVRNTLVHVLSAEWGWLARCGGPERGPALKPDDYPTVESLLSTWRTVEGLVRAFLSTLTDADLSRNAEYTNPRGEKRAMPVGEMLQHSANHAVHHRGQVSLLLRLLGQVPGNFDLLYYCAEKRGTPVW